MTVVAREWQQAFLAEHARAAGPDYLLVATPGAGKTLLFLRGGQEKRPFGRYELTSSNNLPSIERGAGAGIRSPHHRGGVVACSV